MATPSVPERDAPPRMSPAAYVAFELASPACHEYHDGRVYAMAGASRAHNRIAGNIYARLLRAAGRGPCRESIEGVRLVLGTARQSYPDVMVACGPPPDDPYVETDPCLVVEVRRRAEPGGPFLVDYVIGQGTVEFPCPGAPNGVVAMTLDEVYERAEPLPGSEIAGSEIAGSEIAGSEPHPGAR